MSTEPTGLSVRVSTVAGGSHCAAVRWNGRTVWESRDVPYGMAHLAEAQAERQLATLRYALSLGNCGGIIVGPEQREALDALASARAKLAGPVSP